MYLRQPETPRLQVDRDGADLVLRWLVPEAAAGAVFDMPVPVGVGGDERRVAMPGGVGRTPVPEGVEWAIDPHGRILVDLTE